MDFIRAGRAFTITGRDFGPPHLWFVLTDPDLSKVVIVSVVTPRPHTDKTTTLRPKDHHFLQHDSNVDYGGAKFFPVSKLQSAIEDGRCLLQPDMDPELLRLVRRGLLMSPRTVHAIADFCSRVFPDDCLPQQT